MYANVSTIRSAIQSHSGYAVILSISFTVVVWFSVAAEWYIYIPQGQPIMYEYILISVCLLFGVNIQYTMWWFDSCYVLTEMYHCTPVNACSTIK